MMNAFRVLQRFVGFSAAKHASGQASFGWEGIKDFRRMPVHLLEGCLHFWRQSTA
jgi:hypothetical protein